MTIPFSLNAISFKIFLLTLFLIAPLTLSAAELRLSGLFTDHSVLQRDAAIPVWGSADAGEGISITFGNQTKTAKADNDGKWMVRLDAVPASAEGRDLLVQSGIKGRQCKITDVVVGDVWLCSGQSNMHFQMKSVENAPKEIAAANNTALRFFTVSHAFGQKPVASVEGEWKSVSPATVADCSAVAYYFGAALQQKLGVPVGLLVSSVGGTRIETWMRSETLAATKESSQLVEKWRNVSSEEFENVEKTYREYQRQRDQVHPQAVKQAKAQGTPIPPEPTMPKLRCHDCPSALHNGMISPLQPFAIRGAIWYQGESNVGQPRPYEKLLPAMIADWRQVWGNEMPFLFAQLAPHRTTHPAFREAQFHISEKVTHTAMAVTTDAGDAQNIHPTRKRPVGERLALAARALSYGESLVYSGPVFDHVRFEGNRAVISFKNVGGGLVAKGDSLQGFTMAGANGKFLPAAAVIEGATVVVTVDKISKPTAVRFGWATVPEVNLFNREGLPTVPFRTDTPSNLIPVGDLK